MITQVPGIRAGHATDDTHHTGCTVVIFPPDTVGGVDLRGPSPGTRETALLTPDKHVSDVTAVLFTGGSAFGLAAADGVMRYLEQHALGHWTPRATVPIVPAAVVYDLFFNHSGPRPDAEMGYAACEAAAIGELAQGNVGAGAGVTVGKWAGFEGLMKGGFGSAAIKFDTDRGERVTVGAAAVTNCVGDVLNPDGSVLAGARASDGGWLGEGDRLEHFMQEPSTPPGANTTLVVVATDARLTKVEANRLASQAHNGMAIAVRPVHTTHDGDVAFAMATGQVECRYDLVAYAAVEAVSEAIRNSVRYAASVEGVPGLADWAMSR